MSLSFVELFLALLALAANVFVLAVIGTALIGRLDQVRAFVRDGALIGAFVVALSATAGSLYFSEIAGFEPCRLCWYQRIAMYPLVVVLAIAVRRGDRSVRRYVAPVAAIGALLSAYHYALEWFPSLDAGACSASVPCTVVWFRQLGFISLPYLALSAFLAIVTLVWLADDGAAEDQRTDAAQEART
jgi:disulfide bond formation protein DsbB